MFRRFYSSDSLSKKVDLLGEVPKTGTLYSGFLKVAWPAMVEALLMSLVGFIDSVMVSGCGVLAVGSVGLTTQPRMLFYAVFFALSVAVTAIVARRKGQGDSEGAHACLSQAVTVALILMVLLGITSWFVAEPLLMLAGASDETVGDAVVYFRITQIGLMFTGLSLTINSAQRASGNTRISMRSNMVANVVNIVLNYFLINGVWIFPRLGVTGAAIATVIGNFSACTMSVSSLFGKNKYLSVKKLRIFRFDPGQLKLMARISAGAAVEQIFMRFGFFIYAMIIARLGDAEISTHTICMNVLNLYFYVGDGLSVAARALIGQNLGKKRPDLATIYAKVGQRIGTVMSVGLILIMVFLGGPILLLFADKEDQYFEYVTTVGRNILYIIALVSPAQISQVIYNGSLRGAGDTRYVAVTSAISIGVIRPLAAYLLCYPLGLGLYGAWISLLIDQYMRLGFSARRFLSGKWAKIKV